MPDQVDGCLPHKEGQFTIPGAMDHYPPDRDIEPLAVILDLKIDLEQRSLEGEVRTRVRGHGTQSRTLVLDAVDFVQLEVCATEGSGLTWRYDGNSISVLWDEPFEADEERELSVRYRVERPISGIYFSLPDATYPERDRFAFTDHETERARHWLPCVDQPSIRTSYDMRLTAETGLTILAGGVLAEQVDNGDGTQTARWVLDYPCPSYLYCFAVGEFLRVEAGDQDGVEVAYFTGASERADDLERSFGQTLRMMRWMSEQLDSPFPFPKYHMIALPDVCGAMENISLVTFDQRFILDDWLALEQQHYADRVNIHEMAHSYFGDAVVIRDYASAWLKESWATYIECCWLEWDGGEEVMAYQLHLKAKAYFQEVRSKYARPIVTRHFNHSWDMYDRHLYPGGAWRLHMLRRMLGEEPFWSGVQDYVRSFSRKLVETSDFVRKMEEHSGRNLGAFFDQWFYRPGYPCLKIDFQYDAEKGEACFAVEQTQEDDEKGIGLFSFDLAIAVEKPDGAWERATLSIAQRHHQLTLPVEEPRQICIDPEGRMLFELTMNPGDDMLRRALSEGPSVSSRIHAARTLAQSGKRGNCRAIAQASHSEPFWGVRAEMAWELGKSGSGEAVEPLAEILLAEQTPRVLARMAHACGAIRDTRLVEALQAFLSRERLPYAAHAAALESLGRQRAGEDQLMAAANDSGWRSMVRVGALRGLGHLRSGTAFEFLRHRVRYGAEPETSRTAALWALAEAGAWQPLALREQASELIGELTRDPNERVRLAAAAALQRLGIPSAIGDLETMKGGLATQEHPRLARHIAAIRRGNDPDAELIALRKSVEELREKQRLMESRLQALEP